MYPDANGLAAAPRVRSQPDDRPRSAPIELEADYLDQISQRLRQAFNVTDGIIDLQLGLAVADELAQLAQGGVVNNEQSRSVRTGRTFGLSSQSEKPASPCELESIFNLTEPRLADLLARLLSAPGEPLHAGEIS